MQEFSTRRIGTVPQTTLLLGARTRFCEEILTKYEQPPVNLNVKWAISREPVKSNGNHDSQISYQGYVQDVLAEEDNGIMITSESHIYICGSISMAAAVRRRLELMLGSNDARSGDRVLKKMASLGRFQQDVW